MLLLSVTRRWTVWMVVRATAWHGRSERGASLVEYAMLLSLIALVCLGALKYFGGSNGGSLDNSASKIGSSFRRP